MRLRIQAAARAAAGFALVLAAGCSVAPARHPRETREVVLSPGRREPELRIGVVSAVRIVLPGPDPGSGLAWEIGSNNTRVLEQEGPMRAAAVSGAPATAVSFYALKPGRSVLRFYLVHPSERDATPAQACQLAVQVSD
jgi:hypothetical protein